MTTRPTRVRQDSLGRSFPAKRASRLTDQITEEVLEAGWPVGRLIGTETGLLARFRVSRAVFRETVRLLEHRGVARARRGSGGGLVVTEPSVDRVIDSVVLYVIRGDVVLDEVIEARSVLETIASGLAAERRREPAVRALQGLTRESRAEAPLLHLLVAEASQNPALALFVEAVMRVSDLCDTSRDHRPSGDEAEMGRAHARIAQAVIDGDAAAAQRRMGQHLEAAAAYTRRHGSIAELRRNWYARSGANLAEHVARAIARMVIEDRLPPGHLVGTEAELMEETGVGRTAFREAVRILEHQQVARMRRGPGGGLFVTPADAEDVADLAAVFLGRRGMTIETIGELRVAVEMVVAGLAAERAGDRGQRRLAEALVDGTLHQEVGTLSGNRLLEVLVRVLVRLVHLYEGDRLPSADRERERVELTRAHTAIAEAIADGDADLARRRMRTHLEAVAVAMR